MSLSFLDCGCKGKDFFLTSKFFDEKFSSFFLKPISGRLEIIAWPSQPHPLPKDTSTFSSFLKRRSLSKAGAKVGLYNIQAKYIRGFFRVFLKHFYKTLIDKCVEEHIFLRRMKSQTKGTHYNICACARKGNNGRLKENTEIRKGIV